jgi:phosphinothricin acetyltransferase
VSLVVREATAGDAARMAEIYRPYVEETAISFEEVAPSPREMAARLKDRAYPWLVAERDGVVLGYAYASPHRTRAAYRFSVEISAYVDPAHHRSGVGRGLYRRLISLLKDAGVFNAYAGIAHPDNNPGSVGLHEAFGFRKVGVYERVGFKSGRWHDVGWWGLRLQEGEPS